MKALYLLLLTALLVSVIGVVASCTEGHGSIEGRITDKMGEPVTEAWIIANNGVCPGRLETTDEDGRYRFNNIPVGEWEMEFYDGDGWRVGLESVTVTFGETTVLDFTIGAKPPPAGLPKRIPAKSGEVVSSQSQGMIEHLTTINNL